MLEAGVVVVELMFHLFEVSNSPLPSAELALVYPVPVGP